MERVDNLSPLKRAILEIRDLRAQLDEVERTRTEPIAIVGMGLRFPGGAHDADSFWQLLRDGVDAITEVPRDRWDVDAYFDPDVNAPGKMTTRYGGFIDGIDQFDPQFFGISPREALSMDPQQRLMLEVAWEALENAGQAPDKLAGSDTGVFIGIANSDYFRIVFADPEKIDTYASTGNTLSVAAGRLSYLLGLHGPAMSIDTACSSSLVAAHLAAHSLRNGECRTALVGGVSVILMPDITVNFSKSQMMAADGRCKTFDARADGYVRSEGVAMIVLKRLSDALADGDHVIALIRSTAINHDGRSSGLTAPNGPAQEAVIRDALAQAGLEPKDVSYVEAHGTGTALGDPIEAHALGAALGPGRDRPLLIGSVKTNVGHLEAAAGIAGLIKVALMLQHGEIPPSLHFEMPNPHIEWSRLPVTVVTRRLPWNAARRIAGVSSFGFSGTNAHALLEAAPDPHTFAFSGPTHEGEEAERPLHVLTLSARSGSVLKTLARRVEEHLANYPTSPLTNVCFTLNAGRSHFAHRLAIVAESTEQMREKMSAFASGQSPAGAFHAANQLTNNPTNPVFLFTGHGSLYADMGRQLFETQPVFRKAMEQCNELLHADLGVSLISVLYPDQRSAVSGQPSAVSGQPSAIKGMFYAQPALFALEYALATLWRSWGIEPAAVLGHSMGEYVAACSAGVFSLADGLKLVAARGRLLQSLASDGEMATVFADEATVAEAIAPCSDDVSIAAINGPEAVTISGRSEAVQRVLTELKTKKIKSRKLPIAAAAHSPLIEPLLDEFEKIASEVTYAPPQIALVSSMTGQLVKESDVTNAAYWRQHLRQPVRFADAMRTLHADGHRAFVEIGPNPTLLTLGQRCIPDSEPAHWLPSLREGWPDWQQMLESLATLYVNGASVDWAGFDRDYPRHKRPLPTYPWERKSYWIERPSSYPTIKPSNQIWESLVQAGRQQSQQAPLDLSLHTYADKWRVLHRLTVAYAANTLHDLGAFAQAGERHSADSLLAQFKIAPAYRSLIARWLRKLADEHLLQPQPDGTFVSPQPLRSTSRDTLWNEAKTTLADMPVFIDYVQDCGHKATGILTGSDSPLETLFPGGSFDRAEGLYQHWAVSRYFNHIVRAVAESVASTTGQVRVIEIGAGTGATAAALLPALPADRTTYHFTDVSDLFLDRAREKFSAYPFVRYGLLNIEQEPHAQGYARHTFDVVVAANVLHATHDLSETLQHARSLLSPNGVLVLYEATTQQSWFDITTGLIEGWQRFDDEIRSQQDHPLLSPAQWEQVMRAAGFEDMVAFPETGSAAEILGQHVIVARPPQSVAAEEIDAPVAAAQVNQAIHTQPDGQTPADDLMQRLQDALPDERHDLLIDFVRGHVARVLRLDPTDPLDRKHRLMDLGVDSLMAVELRGRLSRSLGLTRSLPATLVFDYPTVEAIADYLLSDVLRLQKEQEAGEQEAREAGKRQESERADIGQMSDEEVEALLMKKLKAMK